MTQQNANETESNKKLLYINIKRKGTHLVLYIKTNKDLEDLFRNENTRTSSYYTDDMQTGLEFYELNNDNIEAMNQLIGNATISRFGSEFFRYGNEPNFSILRSVNISEGIEVKITNLVSEEKLTEWAKTLKDVVIKIYKNFCQEVEIVVDLSIKGVC